MKTIKAIIMMVLLGMGSVTFAQDKPVMAVPLFSNKTAGHVTRVAPGVYQEERLSDGSKDALRKIEYAPGEWTLPEVANEVATDACTNALTATHRFRILTRSTPAVKMIDVERAFQGTGAGTEATKAFQTLIELNAKYLLLGRINRFRVDETKAVAYGVRRWQVVTSISMDLQLINVNSQEIIAGREMSKRIVMSIPESVTTITGIYDWEAVLREAVSQAVPEFINSVQTGVSAEAGQEVVDKVTVNVASTPAGADVEFDGVYYGNTPCQVDLPAKPGMLSISAAGYEPWEKRLVPNNKMNIAPVLRKQEKPAPALPVQPQPVGQPQG